MWGVTGCGLVNGEHRFGSKCCPCAQGKHGIWYEYITLKPAQTPSPLLPLHLQLILRAPAFDWGGKASRFYLIRLP